MQAVIFKSPVEEVPARIQKAKSLGANATIVVANDNDNDNDVKITAVRFFRLLMV